MKYLKYILSIGLLVGTFSSCEQFLTEPLDHKVSAGTYYTTEGGLEDAVKACYTSLKDYWSIEMGATLNCFGTDEYTNGADGGHKGINFYDSQLNSQESYFRDSWRNLYRAVNQCNAVVGRAAGIEGIDEALRNERVAEARFLRGLYYFTLVRMYGDVHFSLEETQGVETTANKTARLDIMDQGIIPDLEFAIANLPTERGSSEYGRAHKAAAEFLLAKVALTRGWLTGTQGDFTQARDLMDNVIDDYDFELLENWGDIFDHDAELHPEVVFSIQNIQDPILNGGNGNRMHLYFLMEYDVLAGMTRDIENGRPWKRFRPTDWLINLWNDTPGSDPQALGTRADVRYQEGFKHVFFSNKPETGGVGMQLGDSAVFLPGVEVTEDFRNSKNYLIFTPSEYSDRRFPTLAKFLDNKRADRQQTQGSRDWMLMRLSDAYLIAAEAAFKAGDTDAAAAYINTVRERAGRDGREGEMTITAADVDIDYILDERSRELAGEMHRWFDLTRTGKLVERVRLHNPTASPNIQDHHALRPIPQDQIDKVDGGYAQNPGY
ncbi:MAG: RagB/SusD family nutrient uptake outer membrane protein [Bacteroidia bacterium]